MIKLPFSRLPLCVVLVFSIFLIACDINDKDEIPVSSSAGCNLAALINCALIVTNPDANGDGNSDYFVPGTHPRWNPAVSDIPLNTDILFAGSTDGTAYIDMSNDPANPVLAAINDLDGWSVNAAFNIPFSGAIDPTSIDASPMSTGQNVFVIALNAVSGGDVLDPGDIDPANPIDATYTVPVTAAAVSLDGGTTNVLRITPIAPLAGPRKYLVIVTNGITAAGVPITAAANYDLLGSSAPLADAALQPLRDAVSGWEQLAVGYLQARNTALNTAYMLSLPTSAATLQASLALTYTFTTTNPLTPLVGMASPRAAWFANLAPTIGGAAAVSTVNNLDAAELLPTPKARTVEFSAPADFNGVSGNTFDLNALSGGALSAGVAKLYTGTITLPYYLTSATTNTDFSFLGKFWTANTSLIAALGINVPADIADGSGNDVTTNFTWRFPFAAKTSDVTVPLQVTLPNPSMTPTGFPANCGSMYGNSGYPVVIYIHGITSDRASVLALAHSLAGSTCVATVAIDLPVHGVPANSPLVSLLNVDHGLLAADPVAGLARERHFEVVADAAGLPQTMTFPSTAAIDGSGAWFINLANLQNTRDNLRQAVMDQLNLNASLANIDADGDGNADFDTSKVSVVGVSLGGIIATTFTTANQLAIANDTAANAAAGATVFPLHLNNIKAMVASAAGGQLTRILENSLSIAPRVLAGLHLAGAVPGTSDFESFMFTAQSTIDSGDPLNFAQTLGLLDVPVLLQEIIGSGDASAFGDSKIYVADKVVPNNAADGTTINYGLATHTSTGSPLAGTDPLATLLGATGLVFGMNDASTTPLLTRMTTGHHASLLRPNENSADAPTVGEYIATAEMQTQVVSFIANPASVAVGTVGTVLGLPANTSCSYVDGCQIAPP